MNQNETIINIWKSNGFVGVNKMKKILTGMNISIKNNDLKSLLQQQKTDQIHKKFNKTKKILGHIISYGVNNNWQLDLSDMSQYSNQNNGYKFILLAVDVFTRRAFAQPLKNKTEKSVTEGFNKMVDDEMPKSITSDNGTEFTNKEFNKNAEEKDINLIVTQVGDHNALGIIDRLTRTLKEMTHKYFTENDTVKWVEYLPKLIETYNNLPHSGLPHGMSPNQTLQHNPEVLNQNLQKAAEMDNIKPDVHVGDNVRIKLPKTVFSKGYIPQYSSETYKVIRVMKVSVILEDGKRVKISDIKIVNTSTRDELPFSNPQPKAKPKPNPKPIAKPSAFEISVEVNKNERKFKKSGLTKDTILEGKRVRKTKSFKGKFSDESEGD